MESALYLRVSTVMSSVPKQDVGGSKTLDGTKTVATVDGTDIPLGVVSLYAREQQQQTTTMYLNYMGSARCV